MLPSFSIWRDSSKRAVSSLWGLIWQEKKKKSGSFAEEPNAISELCGFVQIFISVKGCVLCIIVLDFCSLLQTAKPLF